MKRAIDLVSRQLQAANGVARCLSDEYTSAEGWKDIVANSFFDYTSPIVKKMDEMSYCVAEMKRACSHAASYDEKREEEELAGLRREVASL